MKGISGWGISESIVIGFSELKSGFSVWALLPPAQLRKKKAAAARARRWAGNLQLRLFIPGSFLEIASWSLMGSV